MLNNLKNNFDQIKRIDQDKEIKFVLDVLDKQKDIIIKTDSLRPKQIISISLNNALKSSKKEVIRFANKYRYH